MTGIINSDTTAARDDDAQKSARKAFIIKVGILGWGVPVALAVTAYDWYQGTPVNELAVPLAIRLVLFGLVGGIAFGAVMWKFSQRAAAKPQA